MATVILLLVLLIVPLVMVLLVQWAQGGGDGVTTVGAADPGLRINDLEREVRRLRDEVRRQHRHG